MKIPLALCNLLHNKFKTAVAISGVVFAIVLMFMQLGFLEAVKASATILYDALDFDICLRSKDYLYLSDTRTFPRNRILQTAGVEGVASATPLLVSTAAWRNPDDGNNRMILCFGLDPAARVFRDRDIETAVRSSIRRSDDLLIDTKTRREFGPRNGKLFGKDDLGKTAQINGNAMQITGLFTCGAGLSAGGATIMNERGFHDCVPTISQGQVSLGLVKILRNGDAAIVAEKLKTAFRDDVDIKTRDEVLTGELHYWVYETNYGLIFQTGVAMSLIVGIAIVYQVLATDVANMLPEYATLKAMGYGNRYLAATILQQALILAVSGFVIAFVISKLLYVVTAEGAQIPVRMTTANIALVFVLSVVMCVGSGLAALRKVFKADPADLF